MFCFIGNLVPKIINFMFFFNTYMFIPDFSLYLQWITGLYSVIVQVILISSMAPNPVNFHWIKTGSIKNNLLYYMQIAKVQNRNKTIVIIPILLDHNGWENWNNFLFSIHGQLSTLQSKKYMYYPGITFYHIITP